MADKKVKPKDMVDIEWTGSDKFNAAGTKASVHTALAEKLIAAGKAVKPGDKYPEKKVTADSNEGKSLTAKGAGKGSNAGDLPL